MVNMLSALMEKLDNMQKQMGNISTELETLRKNQKWMLEIKKCKRNEEFFDELHNRLNMAENRINELKEMSVGTSKREYKEIKEWERLNRISINCGIITKGVAYVW